MDFLYLGSAECEKRTRRLSPSWFGKQGTGVYAITSDSLVHPFHWHVSPATSTIAAPLKIKYGVEPETPTRVNRNQRSCWRWVPGRFPEIINFARHQWVGPFLHWQDTRWSAPDTADKTPLSPWHRFASDGAISPLPLGSVPLVIGTLTYVNIDLRHSAHDLLPVTYCHSLFFPRPSKKFKALLI